MKKSITFYLVPAASTLIFATLMNFYLAQDKYPDGLFTFIAAPILIAWTIFIARILFLEREIEKMKKEHQEKADEDQ